MSNANVYVYRVSLPGTVHEMVVPNREDDGYSVYIADDLDDDHARSAYRHAMKHITGQHFELAEASKAEYIAHSSY